MAVGVALVVGYLVTHIGGPPRAKKPKGPVSLDPQKKIPFKMIKKEASCSFAGLDLFHEPLVSQHVHGTVSQHVHGTVSQIM